MSASLTRYRTLYLFWGVLALFFAIDTIKAWPLDWSLDPAPVALGSGQAATGGHCSAAPK